MQIDTRAAMALTDPAQWRAMLTILAAWTLVSGSTAALCVIGAVRWAGGGGRLRGRGWR